MARAKTTKLNRTFVKGLITEAGPLTYPQDATIDEDNTVLYRAGNRSRRLGINLESNHISDIPVDAVLFHQAAVNEYRWDAVNNDADKSFLVQQVGFQLFFYDITVEPLVANRNPTILDLTPYVIPGYPNAHTTLLSFASGRGYLFICGAGFEPMLLQYNPQFNNIVVIPIYIQIRDFKGVADNLANDQEPTTLTDAHHYNLRNQGWVDSTNDGTGTSVSYFDPYGGTGTYAAPASTPITTFFTSVGRYPGNNKQWWSARDTTTGDFDPSLLEKLYFGTTLAPRGHYVVNAFRIDRTAVSGVPNIPVESTQSRPVAVAFANGRAWYGHDSTVYFSQVLDDKSKAGFCYQEADPTSEDISDLIATDGGVIPIPEMSKLLRLVPVGNGIVAFAQNGVWYISGTQSGFTALDYAVSKISPIGTKSPLSIIDVEGQIYWWSDIGIMAMAQRQGMFGTVDGVFEKNNITEQTIQTFYNDIPDIGKKNAKAVYDPLTNVIQWLFQDENMEAGRPFCYNRFLNLDLTLQAFYPWTIGRIADTTCDVIGVFTTPVPAGYKGPLESSVRNTYIKYTVIQPNVSTYLINFAESNDIGFVDWGSQTYLSFLETGYELLEDAMRKKQAPWIMTYFRRTEEHYIPVGGGDFTTDRQSSCMFQVKWDWASSSISNKYSSKREAYRHTRVPLMSSGDLDFDTGFPIVISKHKVRGNGRSIQFRFESDAANRDFDLLGWSSVFTGNTEV